MSWSDEVKRREPDADVLIRRGAQEQADGNLEEAESLFRDAFRALENASAPSDPVLGEELPILLRDLSRLYIERSEYARAAWPLQRLLAIAEAQGNDRPEVATVLASLAAVRSALGEYAQAEELYRQALSIRERTLSPNHITTAATMESLAEACAARGRFAEAISLDTRALSIRAMTLGANDATVRVARQRIANLQLEAQEEQRISTPPRSTTVIQSAPAVQPAPPVVEPLMERRPLMEPSSLPPVLIPLSRELAAMRDEIESTSPEMDDDLAPWRNTPATRSPTTIAVVAGVVVLLAVLGLKLQFGSKPDLNTFAEAEPYNPAAQSASRPVPATAVPAIAAPIRSDSFKSERPRPQASPVSVRVAPQTKRANAIVPPPKRVDVIPNRRAARLSSTRVSDSARVRASSPTVQRAPERARSESAIASTSNASTSNVPASNAPTSPTLIGTVPQPAYPEALRAQQVEGDVVVQFVVDETGRADAASMTVVRSPHVLLTNAVRAALPQLRYEPARTGPPQSIPRPETVRRTFTFVAPPR